MNGVLLGTQAISGLNPAALGLTFCPIPAGTYLIGAADLADNPHREVKIDAFDLADAPLANRGLRGGLQALGGRDTVLMVETAPDRRFDIVARGTMAEVAELKGRRLQDALAEMGILRAVGRVGDIARGGGCAAFDLFGPVLPRIYIVTLEDHRLSGFDGDDQPTLVSFYEASALGAAFGLILPTGEMWEAAAGDLRDEKYLNEGELRKVAHFRPASATADVKSKEPNNHGLYDMLGNVWERMANRYRAGNDGREIRGGAWFTDAVDVRVALRNSDRPDVWNDGLYGCRFARQDSKKIT